MTQNLTESLCQKYIGLNTTYNDDDRVPPYAGIMFVVSSLVDLEIETMELNLRFEEGANLSVGVYTYFGDFQNLDVYDPANWTLVANSQAVPAPGTNGVIIPAETFAPVQLKAQRLVSFYVTLKGRYLNFKVNALEKTGDLQLSSDVMDIMVGLGFNESGFPGVPDKMVHPEFAGVIYYRTVTNCSDDSLLMATSVEFEFLVGIQAIPGMLAKFSRAVDSAMDAIMNKNAALKDFQAQHKLKRASDSVSSLVQYNGTCPIGWEHCPDGYYSVQLNFQHELTLDPDILRYEVLRTPALVTESVKADLSLDPLLYIGLESASAKFQLTFGQVPQNQTEMDPIQVEYFIETTRSFLQIGAARDSLSVLGLLVQHQNVSSSTAHLRQSRLLQNRAGSLYIEGTMLGAQPAGTAMASFASDLEDLFRAAPDMYLGTLQVSGLRTRGQINEQNRLHLFSSLSYVDGNFIALDVAASTISSSGSSGSGRMLLVLVATVGGIIIVTIAVLLRRHQLRKAEDAKTRKKVKEWQGKMAAWHRDQKLTRTTTAETVPSGQNSEKRHTERHRSAGGMALNRSKSANSLSVDKGQRRPQIPRRTKSGDSIRGLEPSDPPKRFDSARRAAGADARPKIGADKVRQPPTRSQSAKSLLEGGTPPSRSGVKDPCTRRPPPPRSRSSDAIVRTASVYSPQPPRTVKPAADGGGGPGKQLSPWRPPSRRPPTRSRSAEDIARQRSAPIVDNRSK